MINSIDLWIHPSGSVKSLPARCGQCAEFGLTATSKQPPRSPGPVIPPVMPAIHQCRFSSLVLSGQPPSSGPI